MANIKISELNELSKVDRTDIVPIVDVSANETKKVLVGNLIEKNVELLAISDTAPSVFEDGDKYYNTSTKKIYTAIDGSWSETGETPLDGLFYIVFNEQSSYAWNGSDLVSVGGASLSNVYGTSNENGYTQEYLNEKIVNVGVSIDNNVLTNILIGKNLFDKSNVEKGYLNIGNGSVTSSNDWNTTQFISLSSNVEHITIIGNKGANEGYCFYDSSKTFISGGSMSTSTSKNIIIPSNAKYFRITVSNDVLNSYAIYFNGNTTDGYQPYITPTINVDGEDIYSKPVILWTNSSPSSRFNNQAITLSSSDYNYLEVYCSQTTTGNILCPLLKIKKGYGGKIITKASGTICDRNVTYTNETTLTFDKCYIGSTENNDFIIPLQVIGYK